MNMVFSQTSGSRPELDKIDDDPALKPPDVNKIDR
jgi:hypothetical protein